MEYLVLILPAIFFVFLGKEGGFLLGSIFFLGCSVYGFLKKKSLIIILLSLVMSFFWGYNYIEAKKENKMMEKIFMKSN